MSEFSVVGWRNRLLIFGYQKEIDGFNSKYECVSYIDPTPPKSVD